MAAVTFCDPMTSSGLPLLLAWLFRVPTSNTPVRIGNETGGALKAPLSLEKTKKKIVSKQPYTPATLGSITHLSPSPLISPLLDPPCLPGYLFHKATLQCKALGWLPY